MSVLCTNLQSLLIPFSPTPAFLPLLQSYSSVYHFWNSATPVNYISSSQGFTLRYLNGSLVSLSPISLLRGDFQWTPYLKWKISAFLVLLPWFIFSVSPSGRICILCFYFQTLWKQKLLCPGTQKNREQFSKNSWWKLMYKYPFPLLISRNISRICTLGFYADS